ncbi:hypothetical protein EA473_02985 [Natrarchaeobius chitinivorans]|uniref:Uncharacterized protein n=1 Tax=Natrarchaeobius chitinivorans TaxID=1679083 RepID=A0A3N6M179_NATCH|nr:hypothetical protein EA473_02985 [Natrarchaeobius chitinivorans]
MPEIVITNLYFCAGGLLTHEATLLGWCNRLAIGQNCEPRNRNVILTVMADGWIDPLVAFSWNTIVRCASNTERFEAAGIVYFRFTDIGENPITRRNVRKLPFKFLWAICHDNPFFVNICARIIEILSVCIDDMEIHFGLILN